MNTYTITAGDDSYQSILLSMSVSHDALLSCQIRLGLLSPVTNYHALYAALIQEMRGSNGNLSPLIVGNFTSFQHFTLALPAPDDIASVDTDQTLHAVVTVRYHSAQSNDILTYTQKG